MSNSFKYQIYKAFVEKYQAKPLSYIAWGSLTKKQLSNHISNIISSK